MEVVRFITYLTCHSVHVTMLDTVQTYTQGKTTLWGKWERKSAGTCGKDVNRQSRTGNVICVLKSRAFNCAVKGKYSQNKVRVKIHIRYKNIRM